MPASATIITSNRLPTMWMGCIPRVMVSWRFLSPPHCSDRSRERAGIPLRFSASSHARRGDDRILTEPATVAPRYLTPRGVVVPASRQNGQERRHRDGRTGSEACLLGVEQRRGVGCAGPRSCLCDEVERFPRSAPIVLTRQQDWRSATPTALPRWRYSEDHPRRARDGR